MPQIETEELKQMIKTAFETERATLKEQLKEELATEHGEDQREAIKQEVLKEIGGLKEEYEAKLKAIDDNTKAKELLEEGLEEEKEKNPFKSFTHFAIDIWKAGRAWKNASSELLTWDKYVRDKAAGSPSQSSGALEDGAALIPTEYAQMLLERTAERNDILANAFHVPMGTNKIEIPYLEGFDESQGKVAGSVVFYWKGEEAQYTGSNFNTGTVGLTLNKCTGMAVVDDELLKWSAQSVGPILERAFTLGMNRAINKACIRGTGAGQPLGMLEANCCIEVGKETNQEADTFVYENMLNMYAQMYSFDDSAGEAIWYMNKTLIPQLGLMNVTVGTGGAPIFINTVQGKPGFSLWGHRVNFNSQMSALGDSGDAAFFDPSQYIVGEPAGGLEMESNQSIHLYFDYDQKAFKWRFWMDGQPWWRQEFYPEYGDKQSPFVKLEAR